MKWNDPLEHESNDEFRTSKWFQNKNVWIIIIVVVLGILSHVFIPRQDAKITDVPGQAKSNFEHILDKDSDNATNSTKDLNGMNTMSGK